MRLVFGICLLTCFGTGTSCNGPETKNSSDAVIRVAADDQEMNGAIAKARATLPTFYSHWRHPGPGETDFNVKVKITDGSQVEHFWLGDLAGTQGHLTGVVGNDAEIVHSVKLGQRIPIPDAEISDWMYLLHGKIVGNLTARVLFKSMSQSELAKEKAKFNDP